MFNKINISLRSFFDSRNRETLFRLNLPALICVAIFSFAAIIPLSLGISGDNDKTNKLIIDTATKSLDDIFKNIDDVYKAIEGSVEGGVLFGEGGIISYDSTDLYSKITDTMGKNISANSFIEEIVILKKGEPLILTSQGAMSKKYFFSKNYVSEVYGMNFFDNITTDYLNVKVIPAASYKNMEKYPAEDPKNLLSCVKRYKETNINIIIFISCDRFVKAANLTPFGSHISFKIYDYNDSVIYSNSASDYMINTTKLSKDFDSKSINLGLKKYYISKSGYNYFYYVAEVKDILFVVFVISLLLLLFGFVLGGLVLMRGVRKTDELLKPAFISLGISDEEAELSEIAEKIREYKTEIDESAEKIGSMGEEIRSSLFLKAVTSSSFYSRYKKTVDAVFSDVAGCESLFILSVETIRDNIKLLKFDLEKISAFLNENSLKFIFIEEKVKKHLYIIGCEAGKSADLINSLKAVFDEIRGKGFEILVCHSREFNSPAGLYDAFSDIRICRAYRGINDKKSLLNTEGIAYGNHMYLPPNFKEELAGRIMAREDVALKKYIKEIFDKNIENNIPLSRFELMLRQMLNTVIDTLSTDKRNGFDMYELEQVFLAGIEQLKENHDVYGIINSFVNLLHLSINMCDTKKSTLNRADVIKYINANFTKDLYLEKIASQFGTTPKYFSNYFKKEFLVGFNEYITGLRISRAKKLLIETKKPLSEISMETGYQNQATFAAAFKKVTGLPPGKYREINVKI